MRIYINIGNLIRIFCYIVNSQKRYRGHKKVREEIRNWCRVVISRYTFAVVLLIVKYIYHESSNCKPTILCR